MTSSTPVEILTPYTLNLDILEEGAGEWNTERFVEREGEREDVARGEEAGEEDQRRHGGLPEARGEKASTL